MKMLSTKNLPPTKYYGCAFCRGERNHREIGREMFLLRFKAGLRQKELAPLMKISTSFLGDLENGRRNWTPKRIKAYTDACKKGARKIP